MNHHQVLKGSRGMMNILYFVTPSSTKDSKFLDVEKSYYIEMIDK